MLGYEMAARAVREGIKIRHVEWSSEKYVYWKEDTRSWVSEQGLAIGIEDLMDNYWCEYKEPEKKIELSWTQISQAISKGIFKELGRGGISFDVVRKELGFEDE